MHRRPLLGQRPFFRQGIRPPWGQLVTTCAVETRRWVRIKIFKNCRAPDQPLPLKFGPFLGQKGPKFEGERLVWGKGPCASRKVVKNPDSPEPSARVITQGGPFWGASLGCCFVARLWGRVTFGGPVWVDWAQNGPFWPILGVFGRLAPQKGLFSASPKKTHFWGASLP